MVKKITIFTFLLFFSFVNAITLEIGGDIMLSRTVWYLNKKYYNWTFSIYNPFCENKTDIILANLESPLVYKNDNDYKYKTFIFKANHKSVKILNEIKKCSNKKILILNLANNHIRNWWIQGLKDTINILNKNWIYYFGAWLTPKLSHKILEIQIDNQKLCFQGYSYDWWYKNGIAVNSITKKWIKIDIEKMKNLKCNYKIIVLHWGREYRFRPLKRQKDLAHWLIKQGVNLVIGWHSHVPWPVEKYKNWYIFYSLWNTIFDQNWWLWYYDKTMDTITVNKKKYVPTFIWSLFDFDLKKNLIYNMVIFKINYWRLERISKNFKKEILKIFNLYK